MTRWNVYLNGKKIDEVSYDENCDKNYVKYSLINHDNYDQDITIRKNNKR